MLFLYIFAAAILGIGALSQVFMPWVRGQPAFPSLRRVSLKQLMSAKHELTDAHNALAEANVRKQEAEARKMMAEIKVEAAKLQAEAASLEMTAYEISENLLDGRIETGRALPAGSGEPDPPNGKDTAH